MFLLLPLPSSPSLLELCCLGVLGLFCSLIFFASSSSSSSSLKQVGLAKTNNYNLTITYFVDFFFISFLQCVCVCVIFFPNLILLLTTNLFSRIEHLFGIKWKVGKIVLLKKGEKRQQENKRGKCWCWDCFRVYFSITLSMFANLRVRKFWLLKLNFIQNRRVC